MDTKVQFSKVIAGMMRLGSWGNQFDTKAYRAFIDHCLEQGVDSFDHADIYGDYTTEADFGKVLKEDPALRDQIKLITKCGIRRVCDNRPEHKVKSYDSSADHIIESVNQSLKNLNTDYIDALLLHRPDVLMEPLEITVAVDELKAAGKIRSFGVSNFNTHEIEMLQTFTSIEHIQIEISIAALDAFQNGILNVAMKNHIAVQAWSPLGGGALFEEELIDSLYRIKRTAEPIMEKYALAFDELLYAWLAKHPSGIIPVTGTSKPARIDAANKGMSVDIDKEDWYALYQAANGKTLA